MLLAGHVDTVPIGRSASGYREGGTIHGRGAADMKAGLAVMLELAQALAGGGLRSDLDVGLVCFGREELPFGESALREMCFLWVYYYPSHGFDVCTDGTCFSR